MSSRGAKRRGMTAVLLALGACSADAHEGVTSFLEKRPAEFPDRVSAGLPDLFPGEEEPAFR